MDEMAEVRATIGTIPAISGYDGPIERLGGLTNRVYRLNDLCLRLPGKGTAAYIDRANEAVAAVEAARAGIAPEVIFVDDASGVMVTRFIAGAVTMTPQGFARRKGAAARVGASFAKLHRSGAVFPFRFELFAMIDEYLALLATKDVALPEGYRAVVQEAEAVRSALARSPVPLAPCHCDPLCENFLDTGTAMWIVDWEYSGMNDPMWDLGDLSVEGGFADDQDAEMLQAYFGAGPNSGPNAGLLAADHGRMVIYKAMCDLLWTLWGLIQLAEANPADDFRAYAEARFSRCKALMARPEFAIHLAAI
jgi:thiamine kinase-like enzyme